MLHHLILFLILSSVVSFSNLHNEELQAKFTKLRNYVAKNKLPELTAVQKEEVENVMKEIGPISEEQSKPESDEIFEQNQQSGVSDFMLESDIFPTEAQLDELLAETDANSTRKKRNAAKWQPKWTDGIVYYQLSPEIAAHAGKVWMINAAFQYIQQRTCIKFVPSTTAENRINIIKDGGCYSSIGMVYGVQPMSLADGCGELHGTIIHETMHALGFWHTQSRTDRDNWITVTEGNMNPYYVGNIRKVDEGYDINYTPYEYGSVMHYPPNLWAKAGTLSFVPKWPNHLYTMGSRIVTFYDMKMINDHYGCHAKCVPANSAPCTNGGYPNPNNCQECVCPPGYGGGWCMRLPEGCSAQLTATTAWKSQLIQIGQNNNIVRKQFNFCTHWIKAPAKAQIQVKMTAISNEQCYYGCQNNGFEIKIHDQRMHGIRVCCSRDIGKVFTGALNPMPIISHNRVGLTSYTIQYRYGNIRKVDEGYDINYTPYEYGSVMHYPPNLWAKAGTLSFVPKWPNHLYTMGSRIVTFYDMKMINDHYGCHAKCVPANSAPCTNGGYPNPNNCQECVCPPGYGGGWCMRLPEGCSAQLTATTAWKSQLIQIGQNNNIVRKQFNFCTHWIKAPAKAQIQVKMTAISNEQCYYGCQNNGFEIKIHDQRMHGIRVCCSRDIGKVFTGALNPMPIISHNRVGLTSYTIQYRYVMPSG